MVSVKEVFPSSKAGFVKAREPVLPLREDIKILPAPRSDTGAPNYNIYDPVRGKFFKIGWLEFEILTRWKLGTAQEIISQIRRETTLYPDVSNVKDFERFLSFNCLVKETGEENLNKLISLSGVNQNQSFLKKCLHNYLFFRIPLIKPDDFLQKTLKYTNLFYSKIFLYFVFLFSVLSFLLVAKKFDEFTSTFSYLFSPLGMFVFFISLAFSKMVHELAHAYTAKRYGCDVPSMGVAFVVMCPVLYTDTSEAWKIVSKKKRIAIGSAGMISEVSIAIISLFLWNFTNDGVLKSTLFTLSTTVWITTLFINLSPFMRFDGYYIFSDLLDVANLQSRAFALSRWHLREKIFGLKVMPPEKFSKIKEAILIFYGYGTWIYRFFLYLGIAIAVYYHVFKVLGIILMFVELVWFISKPVYKELNIWYNMRASMQWNKNLKISILLLFVVIFLGFYPMSSKIYAPAILQMKTHSPLFVLQDGIFKKSNVKIGDQVKKSDILFEFSSPEISYALQKTSSNTKAYDIQLNRVGASQSYLEKSNIITSKLLKEKTKEKGIFIKKENLMVKAPHEGVITQINLNLTKGQWFKRGDILASITEKKKKQITAYVKERDIKNITVGKSGYFYPNDHFMKRIKVKISQVSYNPIKALQKKFMASNLGGKIAVRSKQNGDLFPVETTYKVYLDPMEKSGKQLNYNVVLGDVVIKGKSQSFFCEKIKSLFSVILKETGF